jgi:hypothetical protein
VACAIIVGLLAGHALAANLQLASAWTPSPGNHQVVTVDSDRWYNYDAEQEVHSHTVSDWPITVVFYGSAWVDKVKFTVLGAPFDYPGSTMHQWLQDYPAADIWDDDGGLKTGICDSDHIRIYADGDDYLYNVDYGMYVLATTHKDVNECSSPQHGWSEWVEDTVARHVRNKGGNYVVSQNCCWMFNPEPDRWEDNHFWQSSGYATYIYVP